MKKIPSLFRREGSILVPEIHPSALWVVEGQGVATRKWDGTAARWADGQLWARYDAKGGKPTPPGFVACQEPDPITYHHPGWVPANRPQDRWIREAAGDEPWQDGTYEACGPKIGGNPEGLDSHRLIRHGTDIVLDVPRDWNGLREYFAAFDIEGVVWWRDRGDDCDKVKITGSALGVKRSSKTSKTP